MTDFIKKRAELGINNDDLVLEYRLIFAISISKAMLNFKMEAKPKDIVWTKRTTKVRDILPGWRKDQSKPPPSSAWNKFAKNIESRTQNGQERYTVAAVKQDYETFTLHNQQQQEKQRQSERKRIINQRKSVQNVNNKNNFNFNPHRKPTSSKELVKKQLKKQPSNSIIQRSEVQPAQPQQQQVKEPTLKDNPQQIPRLKNSDNIHKILDFSSFM
jgi:hypothetical protein